MPNLRACTNALRCDWSSDGPGGRPVLRDKRQLGRHPPHLRHARILLAGDAEANEEEYVANGPYTGPLTIINVEKVHIL